MDQFEKENPDTETAESKVPDPELISDEEFEKKQKRDSAIIKTAIDGILTFFQ